MGLKDIRAEPEDKLDLSEHEVPTYTTLDDIEWCWSIGEFRTNVQWHLDRRAKARNEEPQIVSHQTIAALYSFMNMRFFRETEYS